MMSRQNCKSNASLGAAQIEAQGKMRNEDTAAALKLALGNDDIYVRMKAIKALSDVKTDEAVDALKQALCDREPKVRKGRGWHSPQSRLDAQKTTSNGRIT